MVGRVSPAQVRALCAACDGLLVVTQGHLTPGAVVTTGGYIQEATIGALRDRGWIDVPAAGRGGRVFVQLTAAGAHGLGEVLRRRSRRTPARCERCRRISPHAMVCRRCETGR